MDFSEALIQLKLGNRIKRKTWNGYWFMPGFVAFGQWEYPSDGLDSATLVPDMILAASGIGFAPAQATQNDLLATDWELI
jgi:hypothetical protein